MTTRANWRGAVPPRAHARPSKLHEKNMRRIFPPALCWFPLGASHPRFHSVGFYLQFSLRWTCQTSGTQGMIHTYGLLCNKPYADRLPSDA